MRWVQKTRVKLFLSFSTGGSSRKSRDFRQDPPVGILSRKKLSRKSPFSNVCKKARLFGLQSKKAVFDTSKSDCIRNVLMKLRKFRTKKSLR